ncbi:hypothetical protein OG21DRAFT_1216973 [Imleria badia]|nr:hypothetical protein OG21DRAFT_1216973 [Imleria badia]
MATGLSGMPKGSPSIIAAPIAVSWRVGVIVDGSRFGHEAWSRRKAHKVRFLSWQWSRNMRASPLANRPHLYHQKKSSAREGHQVNAAIMVVFRETELMEVMHRISWMAFGLFPVWNTADLLHNNIIYALPRARSNFRDAHPNTVRIGSWLVHPRTARAMLYLSMESCRYKWSERNRLAPVQLLHFSFAFKSVDKMHFTHAFVFSCHGRHGPPFNLGLMFRSKFGENLHVTSTMY